MTSSTISDVAIAEADRRRALVAADKTAMAALLADDVVWTHATGAIDTKASYLADLGKVRFLAIDPIEEDILVLGGAAAVRSVSQMQIEVAGGEVLTIKTCASAVWALGSEEWTLRRFQSGNAV